MDELNNENITDINEINGTDEVNIQSKAKSEIESAVEAMAEAIADAECASTNVEDFDTDASGCAADTEGSVSDAEDLVADTEGSVSDAESSVSDAEDPVADTEGSVSDAEDPVADTEDSVSDAEPGEPDSRYDRYINGGTEFSYGSGIIPDIDSKSGLTYYGETYRQSTGYGQNYSTQGDNYNNGYGYGPITEPVKLKKNRKPMPKWLSVLLSAVLFGLVSAGVFIGANEIYYKLNPVAAPILSELSNAKDTASAISVNTIDQIPSTQLVTNVSTGVTDVSATVENVMPAVVSIECTFKKSSFFGTYDTSGAGSGIILRQTEEELLIATNNHVVDSATSITVNFCDGSSAPAITKGTDSVADLAVVSVSLSDISDETRAAIHVATLGDSDSVKVGQMAIAIGNAMGYGQSTTVGYISAKDREVTVDGNVMTLLQTDAAINPGNSGGALLNINGEVIGINSVKYASDEVEGMGFAIPISRAISILDELSNREIVKDEDKGYLGVYLRDVTSATASAYNWPVGIYVSDYTENSAAEAGGILIGDIITGVNGVTVQNSNELKAAITSHRAGTTISVTVQRMEGGAFHEYTIDIVLARNPEYDK